MRKQNALSIIGRKKLMAISRVCPGQKRNSKLGIQASRFQPIAPSPASYSDATGSQPVFGRIGTGSFRYSSAHFWYRSSRLQSRYRLELPRPSTLAKSHSQWRNVSSNLTSNSSPPSRQSYSDSSALPWSAKPSEIFRNLICFVGSAFSRFRSG